MSLSLDLPRRIAATLLTPLERLFDLGDWPFEIAKWMMAQTLLVSACAMAVANPVTGNSGENHVSGDAASEILEATPCLQPTISPAI